MRQYLALAVAVPMLLAAHQSNRQIVKDVLDRMSRGEALPQEILNRQKDLPDMDQAIAAVRDCRAKVEGTDNKNIFAATWQCEGHADKKDHVPMLVYIRKHEVIRIETAVIRKFHF